MMVVVDIGTGNLGSVVRALGRLGVTAKASSSASDIEVADKIILPGVGHFARAANSLDRSGLRDALNEAVLSHHKPILGICLGMQLMARSSEEGDAIGLGWLDATVIKFEFKDRQKYKAPHMGWNTVASSGHGSILANVEINDEFYFAHSYYLTVDDQTDVAGETEYETLFSSAVERDNIFGVQFHPEKSHAAGMRVLKNFIDI